MNGPKLTSKQSTVASQGYSTIIWNSLNTQHSQA